MKIFKQPSPQFPSLELLLFITWSLSLTMNESVETAVKIIIMHAAKAENMKMKKMYIHINVYVIRVSERVKIM